jgi:hypothetical protein
MLAWQAEENLSITPLRTFYVSIKCHKAHRVVIVTLARVCTSHHKTFCTSVNIVQRFWTQVAAEKRASWNAQTNRDCLCPCWSSCHADYDMDERTGQASDQRHHQSFYPQVRCICDCRTIARDRRVKGFGKLLHGTTPVVWSISSR